MGIRRREGVPLIRNRDGSRKRQLHGTCTATWSRLCFQDVHRQPRLCQYDGSGQAIWTGSNHTGSRFHCRTIGYRIIHAR
jgi:hypothetical protein